MIVDASKVLSDEFLAKKLGAYWEQEITQGRGDCFNVNAKWGRDHPDCGLGRVHVSDTNKVFNLRYRVLSYLVKPDYLVRWLIPKRHRIFLKSLARPLTGTKPGRPRISKGIKNEQSN